MSLQNGSREYSPFEFGYMCFRRCRGYGECGFGRLMVDYDMYDMLDAARSLEEGD